MQKFFSLSDHQTVASIASCFIAAKRRELCSEAGRVKLMAMVEVYLWARQDALNPPADRLTPEARAVAEGRTLPTDPDDRAWNGPRDRAIFATLKGLAVGGYISLDDFGWFPREEIRQTLTGVAAERAPCLTQADATQ
jgi:hypothetical protein